jgi:hypothetical protein
MFNASQAGELTKADTDFLRVRLSGCRLKCSLVFSVRFGSLSERCGLGKLLTSWPVLLPVDGSMDFAITMPLFVNFGTFQIS